MNGLVPTDLDDRLAASQARIRRREQLESVGIGIMGLGGALGLSTILIFPMLLFSLFSLIVGGLCMAGFVLGRAAAWHGRRLSTDPNHLRLLSFNDLHCVAQFRVRVVSGLHETRMTLEQRGPMSARRTLRELTWEVGAEDEGDAVETAIEWRLEAERLQAAAREAYLHDERAGHKSIEFARQLASAAGDERWCTPKYVPMPRSPTPIVDPLTERDEPRP